MAAKIDFNLIVSFLTTVYNKRTHQARQQVTAKITNWIIDEYQGHVFWVLKRTDSLKHYTILRLRENIQNLGLDA